MIQTYKVKHNQDYSKELELAKKVAKFAVETKSRTSVDVKYLGLKSAISNQILKKYSSSKTIKRITSVKLTIPNQSIQIKEDKIYIPCLKLWLDIWFDKDFEKINQIEIGGEFAYISVSYPQPKTHKPECLVGIDRNSTKHVLVGANLQTGKVIKLGKSCNHIHKKYSNIRKSLQKKRKLKKLKRMRNREQRIIRNINHQISRKLVNEIYKVKGGLVLENLKNIRQTAKCRKKQRYSLNSWSFYQLLMFIEYKAKKLGIPIFYVAPEHTSRRCSCCGHIEKANRKSSNLFQCKYCGKVENADVNAGFNIADRHHSSIFQSPIERDIWEGNTDTPKEALYFKPIQL